MDPIDITQQQPKKKWTRRQAKLAGSSSSMPPPEPLEPKPSGKRELGGHEISMEGHPFTWANNRPAEGFIEEKLDRMIASLNWHSKHPTAKVLNIFRSASDHSLLFLQPGLPHNHVKHTFCFDKRWLKKPGLKEEIQKAWDQPVAGSAMFTLTEKIKATRVALLKWNRTFHTNSATAIKKLSEEMADLSRPPRAFAAVASFHVSTCF
ncbi:DNAse I-like superfamily protein [Striga asiatica]|uniref:DNAse I-like superfamily protein n=1 Tax=Striga asiatica TaxID=4170 RepID=A0A5A7P041_STRAF|nr:DNAse I-like superfamily protein [Striga asiatica]